MSIFRFKQFAVDQTESAMKVNTDGVLLGATASMANPLRILDIGTGTGVIALMLAQRFPKATVEAIEVDGRSAKLAGENFARSVFSTRVSVQAVALADFQPGEAFDLIVSNPPFFLHALKNRDHRKQVSRHTDVSFYSQMLERADRWLTERGSLQLVAPIALADWIQQRAIGEFGMVVQGQRDIRSFAYDPPIRRIFAIGRTPLVSPGWEGDLVIYKNKGVYSDAYRSLLKDFFLAF